MEITQTEAKRLKLSQLTNRVREDEPELLESLRTQYAHFEPLTVVRHPMPTGADKISFWAPRKKIATKARKHAQDVTMARGVTRNISIAVERRAVR